MKYIILGIKDYTKDIWHDFLLEHLFRFYKKSVIFFIPNKTGVRQDLAFWKEGSVWHYIYQRKLARKHQLKEWVLDDYIKTRTDFVYYIWAAVDEVEENGADLDWFFAQCKKLCKIATKRGWLK